MASSPVASETAQKPVCPVCHRSDQAVKLQAAYAAGMEKFAPPSMPPGTVSMLRYMLIAMGLVGLGAFFIFVVIGSGGSGFVTDLIQVAITLAAIVSALVLSFIAFQRVLQGDRESEKYLPSYDRALENWRNLYYCKRDNVVFDARTGKVVSDQALKNLLAVTATPPEQSAQQSITPSHQ